MSDGHRWQAIDHVAIAVRDVDEAAAMFMRLLGWQVTGDEIVAAAGVRLVYLSAAQDVPARQPVAAVTEGGQLGEAPAADAQLQLVQPVAPGGVADFVAEHGEGLHHICFRTHDIEAAPARSRRTADGTDLHRRTWTALRLPYRHTARRTSRTYRGGTPVTAGRRQKEPL